MAANAGAGAPLSEPVFLILLTIGEEPRHGYAIMQEVESMSEGRVTLGTGTLYGALKRMLDSGWIRRVSERDSRDKQTYDLTPTGREVVMAEAERLENLTRLSRVRLHGAKA